MNEINRCSSFKKMASSFLTAIFTKKVLSESSVTGRGKGSRPPLDRTKVELIIGLFYYTIYISFLIFSYFLKRLESFMFCIRIR